LIYDREPLGESKREVTMLVPWDSRKIAASLVALGVLVLTLVICAPASAQVAGGTLTGTVSDTSGAVIPNVQITIRDVATGVVRTVSTDSAGFYTAPNLLPGTYEVIASASGFATQVRSGITLTVGAQQELNLILRVGQATEKVEVTGEAPAVQLAGSSLSNQVSATTVRELPLNGRDWVQLATLQPGVTSTSAIQPAISGNASSARVNRGFGNGLTISGARPEQNNYRVDGVSVNSYGNGSPGTVLGGSLGVDAVREFSVLTSNYSAEYGRTSGGVVNAITRSGTNQFHGDVYEFLRNSSLDAANFFDNFNSLEKAPFRRNQFGASAGAPIRKDKTFVFGDYEGLRQSLGITNTDLVPSLNARNGILADGTTVTVDPQVEPALALWSPPNGTVFGDTGIYSFAGQSVTTENFVTARVDHKFREQDSVFGTYQYDKALTTLPDALNDVLVGQRAFRQFIALEESHIFSPQFINTVRGGFNRETARGGYGVSAINPAAADPSLAAIPGYHAPQIFVPGLTTFNGGLANENNTTFN
jgi:Carboxypeptidase regulatory-like domain